ncbi:MAG: hypothetical protein LC798_12650, partial [Chloroflexi bacterium]|nr:hypothetical protein [Chloroflexota bacterium]
MNPEGTVRGTFDLNIGPARRKMRELNEAGVKLDKTLRTVGQTMDRVATREQQQRLGRYSGHLRTLNRDAGRAVVSLRMMREEMNRVNRTRVRPEIDLRGLAKASAELAAFETALARIDGRNVSPRVGVGAGGGGGGGGGRGGVLRSI